MANCKALTGSAVKGLTSTCTYHTKSSRRLPLHGYKLVMGSICSGYKMAWDDLVDLSRGEAKAFRVGPRYSDLSKRGAVRNLAQNDGVIWGTVSEQL